MIVRTAQLFLIGFIFLWSDTGFAQTKLAADVEENYSGRVAVSGSIIVGAAFGDAFQKINPGDLIVLVPEAAKGEKVCLTAKTRDGQYWSQAQVNLPHEIENGIVIEPKTGWKFLKELKSYQRSDFAALARFGEDCQFDAKATILPVKYDSGAQGLLRVSINSQRAIRVSAEIGVGHENTIKGNCDKTASVGIRSTAFNYVCSFDLTDKEISGKKVLTVSRRLRVGGKRSDDVEIFIP